MEEEEADDPFFPPFSIVSLSHTRCPSVRRLSSNFTPSRPVLSERPLARMSLQGRLLHAEEASSAGAITGSGLGREEVLAWELFTPIQRFLLVAVIGVAVSESKKDRIISRLRKSVELRDQVLSSMQLKLDSLCDELNNIRSPAKGGPTAPLRNDSGSQSRDSFGCDNIKFAECGCWHCDRHQDLYASLVENTTVKISKGDEVPLYKSPTIYVGEQEERRMSDLSDWASSVTSAADMQMNSFAVDIDIFNLKRECEEKDATIRELTTILQSTDVAGSKRIAELEDTIRRKNAAITRLKKDTMVLDQKIVQLTRLRRSSSASSKSVNSPLPPMVNNIVYDMDSSTSPSSSDSDSSATNRLHSPAVEIQVTPVQHGDPAPATNPKSAPGNLTRSSYLHQKSRPVSPLKELSTNQESHVTSSRAGRFPPSSNLKKTRRQPQSSMQEGASKRNGPSK